MRLGGVHALAHLLRDSADHHQDVVEVLVAFIRQRTPRAASQTGGTANGADSRSGVLLVTSDQALPVEPAPDVQAALTALGRRPRRLEPLGTLNLRNLHLARARLGWANLTGAQLDGADLTRAVLDGADLTGAWLAGADLTRAGLGGANLTRALLVRANLTGAQLPVANLTRAALAGANLTDAWLHRADLTRARLSRADLTRAVLDGANLTDAQGLTQAQLEAVLGDAATRVPPGLERPASWTASQEAVADAAPAGGAAPAADDPLTPPAEHP